MAEIMKGRTAKCIECFNIPHAAQELPDVERQKVVAGLIKTAPGGFAKDALTGQSSISLFEEVGAMAILAAWCGGIYGLVYSTFAVIIYGLVYGASWSMVGYTALTWLFLMFHPIPRSLEWEDYTFNEWFYRYFSYRIVWTDDAFEEIRVS
ncbi:hypothetical protein T484DRAFT_1788441 [Baffinella frigidus]|nr:hypothetical protein T484DRAFT_1788441 [Cryptophyta sp. CCMP2293]